MSSSSSTLEPNILLRCGSYGRVRCDRWTGEEEEERTEGKHRAGRQAGRQEWQNNYRLIHSCLTGDSRSSCSLAASGRGGWIMNQDAVDAADTYGNGTNITHSGRRALTQTQRGKDRSGRPQRDGWAVPETRQMLQRDASDSRDVHRLRQSGGEGNGTDRYLRT